jgi:hypothetical protein
MMAQSLTSALKNRVLESSDITSLIGNRFYEGELANIKGPKFPCINAEIDAGGLVERIPEYEITPFRMWVWGKSRDKITTIYNTLFNEYHCTVINDDLGTTNIRMYETNRPIYNYDHSVESYFLMVRWLASIIKP